LQQPDKNLSAKVKG